MNLYFDHMSWVWKKDSECLPISSLKNKILAADVALSTAQLNKLTIIILDYYKKETLFHF